MLYLAMDAPRKEIIEGRTQLQLREVPGETYIQERGPKMEAPPPKEAVIMIPMMIPMRWGPAMSRRSRRNVSLTCQVDGSKGRLKLVMGY
jgi:hypothetical protein